MNADALGLADRVVAAAKVYIQRAVAGFTDRLEALERRFETLPQPVKGEPGVSGNDGAPGKDAQVDYDRVGAMLKAMLDSQKPRDGIDGKNADPVDYTRIEEYIEKRAAAIPAGKDGKDGRDGVDGKDAVVDYDHIGEVISLGITKEAAKVPTPRDGKDGVDGKDGAPGRDGKDGIHGKDGLNGNDGRDGSDGESIHPDTVRVMVTAAAQEEVAKAVAAIPKPEDGKSADPREVAELVEASVARQFEILRPHIKGEPGEPGIGIDGLALDHDEDAGVARLVRSDGAVVGEVKGLPHDAGVYERGKAYRKGAIATYGGSAFIAKCDTSAPIGGNPPSPDWRLMIQRGRDAR